MFSGAEGCASKEDIVVKVLPIENIVKDIKTVYTEEPVKALNGDSILLSGQEESDQGLKPILEMNNIDDSIGSLFLTNSIFSTPITNEDILSSTPTFPEISSSSCVNLNSCTNPNTVENLTPAVTTTALLNMDSGETKTLSQPLVMATGEESGLQFFGNNCDSIYSKANCGYSDRLGTGVSEPIAEERKSNGENNACNVNQLPALKAIENMAVAATSLPNANMISKTPVALISNERHDELTSDPSVKPLVFSVLPPKQSIKDYLDKVIETKTPDTDIVSKLCNTDKLTSRNPSESTPSEEKVDSTKEFSLNNSQCDLIGNKESTDGFANDHVYAEKQSSQKFELSNSLLSVSLLTSSSLSSPPVLQQQQPLGMQSLSSLLTQPSESIPKLQQETLPIQGVMNNDQMVFNSDKTVVHDQINNVSGLMNYKNITNIDATRNMNMQSPPTVISRYENSLAPSELNANMLAPFSAAPPLIPTQQPLSSDILQNSGQVSKPTPKARKSGPPANQSNYYVKTVNLAPIANIRVKLPVMEKSYNAKPETPPPSATPKMNKINAKTDTDKEDQNISLSDSEKNKLGKNIRPRKRRWGTYDLPNKKRKRKRGGENDGAGDDIYDDDDDDYDYEDTAKDGDELNEKPSLEPIQTDNKQPYTASPMLKNSSTILELLTKQTHTVSKDENSGPIMPHLRRKKAQSLHQKVSVKSGHTGKTVAELLRESQAKQLAAKEFHNTKVVHQSAPFLHKETTDKIIEIQQKLDDSGKENTGKKIPELKKEESSQKKSNSGTNAAHDRHSNKKKPSVFQGLQSILPKPPRLSPKSSLNKASPKKNAVTVVPANPSSVNLPANCRLLPNPPTMPINVVMTSEGAKVSLLSQMVAATSKFPATAASLSSPGLRSLLGPNGVCLPVTPPKTPENKQSPSPKPPKETVPKKTKPKTSTKAASPRSTTASDRDVIPLCCCKINGAVFKKLPALTYCQALDSIDGKVMGCCNKITNNQLVRSAVKIPFMAVCEFHRQSLKQHQCCPGCGHFCMQGRFYQCRKEGGSVIHNFHKQCQVFRDNKYYCPHCGEESSQYEVTLTLNEPRLPSSLEDKKPTKPKPPVPRPSKAKLAIHTRTYRELEKVIDNSKVTVNDAKTFIFKSTGCPAFTSAGIPVGEHQEILEKCFTTLEQERPKKYRSLPKSLYNPCKDGDLTKVIYMLVDGLDPNKPDPDNDDQTAIHAAVIGGHLSVLHVLIQSGGNIHTVDSRLNSPFIYACEHNHMEIVHYLVQAGSFLDVKGEDGMTCLHMAAKGGHIELMEFLLSTRKVQVNVQDDGGWTPIIWAAEHRNVAAVKFLIAHGADPTLKDNEENTGLHWAAFSGSVEIAEIFLNHGCDIESPNEHGDRPLHIAARQDNYKCVVLCLVRGSDVEARNNLNQLPTDCCLDQKSHVWMALKVNKQLRGLAAKRLERQEKLVHRDVSFGRENLPIAAVNIVDDEGPPLDYQYVTESVETTPLSINRVISSLQSCTCKDNCASTFCVCSRNSVKCWYDQMGRLIQEFNQLEPPYIFECNRNCRCWTSCNNRVVQNGIVCRLQLFKTLGRGWGVRTLRDIPQGSFICEYIGELISDSEADRREDDSYLFDLDNKDGETYCIDARWYGNISRFINHLCEPNVIPVKVFVDHQDMRFPRICFFASRDIKAREELGFDYGEKFWVIKWKQFTCACGSPKCKYSADTIRQTLEDYRLRHGDDDSPDNL